MLHITIYEDWVGLGLGSKCEIIVSLGHIPSFGPVDWPDKSLLLASLLPYPSPSSSCIGWSWRGNLSFETSKKGGGGFVRRWKAGGKVARGGKTRPVNVRVSARYHFYQLASGYFVG